MKIFWKRFFQRGLWASVGGPIIMVIVYKCISLSQHMESITVDEVLLGVLTSAVLAFIAGGISAIYQEERVPLLWATLVHAAILYLDYIVIYRINGWLAAEKLPIFTVSFFGIYAVVWLVVWLSARAGVKKMNRRIQNKIKNTEEL